MSEENVSTSESGTPAEEPTTTSNGADAAAEAATTSATAAEAPSPPAPLKDGAADPAGSDDDSEEDDDEDGDNLGNLRPGDLPPDDIGNRKTDGSAPVATGQGKKRRRRNKKKGDRAEGAPQGAPEGAAPAEGDGEEHTDGAETDGEGDGEEHADGAEGGERRAKRPKGDKGNRERPAFSVGEEVFGRVCKVTDHAVWVDIAGKAIGLFDRRELQHTDTPVEEGDQFIATVSSTGVRGGMLVLSQTMPDLDALRERLEAALKSGDSVEGFVTGAVKGGLEIDLGGLRAFAPASHVDLRHGADLSPLVGQRMEVVVTQYAKKGRDIVVSRRKFLEEETRKARAESLSKLEPGSVHKGIVKKVVAWGVFVALPDADNVEGLVHLTEASHDRGARLPEIFKPGAEIDVKVLKVDEKGKLWLSRKAATPDPWDAVREKYAVGSRHKAKVARLQPFGAFMELEPGLDGLIHTADLSQKPIDHPSEIVKPGEEMDVVVVSVDGQHKRIGLHPAIGDENEPRQKVVQHKTVQVAVTQVIEGGLVVRVLGVTGRNARAFIPAGHTGTPRGTDLRKEFAPGTKFEAKVLEVDPRRGEAKLSIRAMKDDAEKAAYQQYRAGVAKEAKFGTLGDLMKKSEKK